MNATPAPESVTLFFKNENSDKNYRVRRDGLTTKSFP